MKKLIGYSILSLVLAVLLSIVPQMPVRAQSVFWAQNFPSGLVGWWPLNEGMGSTAHDLSGYGNTGTWNGTASCSSTYYTTGVSGTDYAGCFVRAGSNYIQFSPINLGTVHTVMAYIKPNTQTGVYNFGPLLGNSTNDNVDPLFVSGATDTTFGYTQGAGGPSATVPSMTGVWHCIASVRSGLAVTLYLDGVAVGSGSLPANEEASIAYVGIRNTTANYYYNGAAARIRFYSYAMSASQVAAACP